MNCLTARLLTALTALLVVTAGSARADYLGWTYTSSPSVPGISAGSGADTATVTLTDYTNKPGALSIPVAAYVTATNASTPVSFNGTTYGLTLTITDSTTQDHGTLSFTGTLNGGLTATSSTLQNAFSASTPSSLTLDGHTYTVTIPTANLVDPTKGQSNILANVSVANAGSPGPVTNPGPGSGGQGTPEPASLILASLGFSFVGAGRWWKRRSGSR